MICVSRWFDPGKADSFFWWCPWLPEAFKRFQETGEPISVPFGYRPRDLADAITGGLGIRVVNGSEIVQLVYEVSPHQDFYPDGMAYRIEQRLKPVIVAGYQCHNYYLLSDVLGTLIRQFPRPRCSVCRHRLRYGDRYYGRNYDVDRHWLLTKQKSLCPVYQVRELDGEFYSTWNRDTSGDLVWVCSVPCLQAVCKGNDKTVRGWKRWRGKQRRTKSSAKLKACRSLFAQAKRALRQGDHEALKSLSEEFKRVRTSRA